MATCPDCGSIIMEGDPYCSHCRAHLNWVFDDGEDRTDNTLTCHVCGHKNSLESEICEECGSELLFWGDDFDD